MPSTLVSEAGRRSGVLWVSTAAVPPTLVWHLWHDDAAYVVCGGDEQPLPPLGPTATVAVRSKAGALVVQWEADVGELAPGSPRWDEVVPLLAAERLNAPSVKALPERWATASRVLELRPRRPLGRRPFAPRPTSKS